MTKFNDNEKNDIVKQIELMYFSQNFGSTSKADFELFLFAKFVQSRLRMQLPVDEYSLSKELGITQTRIRSLKERMGLKYADINPVNWRDELANALQNVQFEGKDNGERFAKVIVQDVSVMNEVRHAIEEHGWYDECSLNKKLLTIPLGCFVELFFDSEDFSNVFDDTVKRKVKKYEAEDNEIAKFIGDFSKEGLKRFLTSASKRAIIDVLPLLPFGGVAEVAFGVLAEVIKRA